MRINKLFSSKATQEMKTTKDPIDDGVVIGDVITLPKDFAPNREEPTRLTTSDCAIV